MERPKRLKRCPGRLARPKLRKICGVFEMSVPRVIVASVGLAKDNVYMCAVVTDSTRTWVCGTCSSTVYPFVLFFS